MQSESSAEAGRAPPPLTVDIIRRQHRHGGDVARSLRADLSLLAEYVANIVDDRIDNNRGGDDQYRPGEQLECNRTNAEQ